MAEPRRSVPGRPWRVLRAKPTIEGGPIARANRRPWPDVSSIGVFLRHRRAVQVVVMRYLLMPLLIVFASADPARDEGPHTFRGKTVEGWLAVFRDKASTDAQRREAVVTLGYFGPEARAAAPDLIEAVRRGPNRDQAVNALVSIGAGADVTVPILIDRLRQARLPAPHRDGQLRIRHFRGQGPGPRRRAGRAGTAEDPERPGREHARVCGLRPRRDRPGGAGGRPGSHPRHRTRRCPG